jgi:hypothetical protein
MLTIKLKNAKKACNEAIIVVCLEDKDDASKRKLFLPDYIT